MAAIKDVAKLAGVSISTVSKYLNDSPTLTDEYRERVEKAVKELNYIPSSIARSLRTQKTNNIALVIPELSNYFYSDMFHALQTVATTLGYRIILYSLDNDKKVLEDLLNNLSNVQIDGIIIAFWEDFSDNDILLHRINVPLALICTNAEYHNYSSVIIDVADSEYRATKYFIDKGHTRIAFINGPETLTMSDIKLSGYKKALADAGLSFDEGLVCYGKYRSSNGYLSTQKLMSLATPPTAIVCANDLLAIGSIKYLSRRGYRIPEDVAIIGMDGSQLSTLYDPSISTMRIPIESMAEEVLNMLLKKIERPQSRIQHALFEMPFIDQQTTNRNAPSYIET